MPNHRAGKVGTIAGMPRPLDYATPPAHEPQRTKEIVIGGIVGAVFGLSFSPLAFVPAVALPASGPDEAHIAPCFLGAMQFVVYGAVWGAAAAARGRGRRALAGLGVAYLVVEALFIAISLV
jgi:hypothetical protein